MQGIPGVILDPTAENEEDGEQWDFENPDKIKQAIETVKEKRAILIICNPMVHLLKQCKTMEDLADPEVINSMKRNVELCAQLCAIQHNQGMYFMYEHMWEARSWNHPLIRQLRERERRSGMHKRRRVCIHNW